MASDRPIIFSGPMVRALLAGRKTQTRRLATSPLRRCEVGDRMYVRESWSHTGEGVWTIADARLQISGRPIYAATHNSDLSQRWWPSIHMPREFSRLTLTVDDVRVEPLQAISETDAVAEGVRPLPGEGPNHWTVDADGWGISAPTASETFGLLWRWLHKAEGQRWEDNPQVVALTFRVEHGNIDTLGETTDGR